MSKNKHINDIELIEEKKKEHEIYMEISRFCCGKFGNRYLYGALVSMIVEIIKEHSSEPLATRDRLINYLKDEIQG